MKKLMKTLSTFNFTEVDGKKLIGDGIEVSYSVRLASTLHDIKSMPLQIVIHVRIDGEVVCTWGCENNTDNSVFVLWFIETSSKVREEAYDINEAARKSGKEKFDALMKKA